jgi:hypothetical protein
VCCSGAGLSPGLVRVARTVLQQNVDRHGYPLPPLVERREHDLAEGAPMPPIFMAGSLAELAAVAM